MISNAFCVVSLLATLAVFIATRTLQAFIFPTLSLNSKGRGNLDDGTSGKTRNLKLLIDISMVAGAGGDLKRSLHHTFSSVPEDKLFRAIMSVLTDVEVGHLEHDIRSGIDSLIKNDDFVLGSNDGFIVPESLNDSVVKKIDFREQLYDSGITGTNKETSVVKGSIKQTEISTDLNQESKQHIALNNFNSENDESFHKSSINPIIKNPAKSEFQKSYQNEATSHLKVLTKTKKRSKSPHSTQYSAVKDDNSFAIEEENDKDSLITAPEIESYRHLIECSNSEIPGEIDVQMISMPKGLVWDVYQNKSDMTLMKSYGKDGKKETCLEKNSCYVFRVHVDTIKKYKIILGGFLVKEGDTASAGQLIKFGWNSCCATSCCASYEAQAEVIIEANNSTEGLNWNLVTRKDTDESQELVVHGGGYDNLRETNTFITQTCINPMICHTLQVFVNNETSTNSNFTSYSLIKVYVNGETKVMAWDVLPGEDLSFCSICSTNPILLPFTANNVSGDERAIDIMNRLRYVSSDDSLMDVASAQYKAICWIIFDDLRQIEANSTSLIQRYVLAELYYETNGHEWTFKNWTSKPNFLSQEDECEWAWKRTIINFYWDIHEKEAGVLCINGTVTEINLYSTNLKGVLPSEIMSLEKLQVLNVSGNELVGFIPKEIGNLKYLTRLDLSGNKISGSLPATFYNQLNLEYLDLGQNKITGTISSLIGQLKLLKSWYIYANQFSRKIPEEIYGLNDLENILIYQNMFTGTISPRIGQLSKLKYMVAYGNMLQGSIPSSIGMTSVRWLSLNDNHVTGKIPTELVNLDLEEIFMQNNMLEGPIPQEIEDIGTLQTLDLSHNYLSGALPSFPLNMTSLYLQGNNFNGTLPIQLSELHLLTSLQLDNTDNFGTVPNEVCELRENALEAFSTDCNGYYVPPEVNCSCCTYCRGEFSDYEKFGSCPDAKLMVKMNYKNFNWYSKYWTIRDSTKEVVDGDQYGHMVDSPEKSFYTSCFASTECFELDIEGEDYTYYRYHEEYLSFTISYKDTIIYNNDDKNNQIWEGKIKFGYSRSSNGPKLNECDNITFEDKELIVGTEEFIAYNQIRRMSGPNIDSSISKAMKWIQNDEVNVETSNLYRFRQRYVLVLLFYSTGGPDWSNKGNFASSEHECQWLGITCDKAHGMIESITLINNNLYGTLPHELGELLKLKVLNLSQNSGLISTIPDKFANLWSLETLDLSRCGIAGSIPSAIGLLKTLVYLNLGYNSFNMSIPVETRNLKQLEELYLNNNFLTGMVPNLSSIKKLKVLDLSNNNVHGVVSKEVIPFKSLVTFNIGNNLFAGTLPFDITQSVNLRKLDISGNLFFGSIPYGFGKFRDLKSVHLGGNQLQGGLPEDLFGIVGLEELDLRDNGLVGTIPTNLGKMIELKHLALDNNELKGTIPKNIKNLHKLRIIKLHANTLTGTEGLMTDCVETWGDSSGRSFVSDCGFPSGVSSPLGCKCCTICCNADGPCQANKDAETIQKPMVVTFIVIATLLAGKLLLRFIFKHARHPFKLPDYNLDLVKAFGDCSVYVFILVEDWKCWVIPLSTSIGQVFLFCIFLRASTLTYAHSDWQYSLRCYPGSGSCIDTKGPTWIGWVFLSAIKVLYLGKYLVRSFKILYMSAKSGSKRCLFGGMLMMTVADCGIIASAYYNVAIAYTDSQIILNAVVLAIVANIDEKVFEFICVINKSWVDGKIEEAQNFASSLEAVIMDHHHHGNDSEDAKDTTSDDKKEIEHESLDTNGFHDAVEIDYDEEVTKLDTFVINGVQKIFFRRNN